MISKLAFGRTGHMSSRILFGGAALSRVTQAEADRALELALSYGVNHVDVAAGYGEAEVRIGNWIKRHGKPFFLATKTDERTAHKTREQIRRSLNRLQVDQIDLLQLHYLVDPQEWEIALGHGGALEAVIEARDQGLVRFIGITGHGLTVADMHRRALERFDFDSVLLPYSYILAQNQAYFKAFWKLVEICLTRQIAVQTIKSLVLSPWGEQEPDRATWYRPLEDQIAIDNAVHWVLGHEELFVNAVGDIHILPRVLDAASRYETKPPEAVMRQQVKTQKMQPLFT